VEQEYLKSLEKNRQVLPRDNRKALCLGIPPVSKPSGTLSVEQSF